MSQDIIVPVGPGTNMTMRDSTDRTYVVGENTTNAFSVTTNDVVRTAGGTLTIVSATAAMNGDQYRCVATNLAGSATTSSAILVVDNSLAVVTLAGLAGNWGSADGTGSAARFNEPHGLACDSAGSLFVADSRNDTIRKVDIATGTVTTLAGLAGSPGSADGTGSAARFTYPEGLTSDSAGNLLVADAGNNCVRKVVIATGEVTTLASPRGGSGGPNGPGSVLQFDFPTSVVSDGAGNLYVADSGSYTIRKVVIATGEVTILAGSPEVPGSADGTGTAAQFGSLGGLAFDGAGNLFVGDTDNNKIRKVVIATRTVTTFAGSGAPGSADGSGTAAQFYYPFGIASDGASNLYVADYWNHTIRKIVIATAAVSTVVGTAGRAGVVLGPLPGGLGSPEQLAVGPAGELFIVDVDQDALLVARF